MAINSITLMGRLTADPELKSTTGGKSVCSFTLAVDRFGGKEADFIPCTAWRATAEFIGKYFHKGDFIGITGAIEANNYEKNGEPRTDICVKINRADCTQNKTAAAPGEKVKPTLQPIDDDGDIPF